MTDGKYTNQCCSTFPSKQHMSTFHSILGEHKLVWMKLFSVKHLLGPMFAFAQLMMKFWWPRSSFQLTFMKGLESVVHKVWVWRSSSENTTNLVPFVSFFSTIFALQPTLLVTRRLFDGVLVLVDSTLVLGPSQYPDEPAPPLEPPSPVQGWKHNNSIHT